MAELMEHATTSARARERTLAGDVRAEARIERDLREIAARVRQALGGDLAGLLLIGGYARNEGSLVDHGGELGPYNDYDLIAVVRGRAARRHDVLDSIGEEETRRRGVDVDLWPVSEAGLERLPPTLFWLDVVLGGVELLDGDPALVDRLPRITARDVPLAEVGRLLTNRAVGLALSNLEDVDRDHRRARHGHKAVLACGDARLLAADRYAATVAERSRELERLADAPGVGAELAAAYVDAVEFRRRPDRWRPAGEDLADWYARIRAAVGRWHLGFEAWRTGAPEEPLDFARYRGRLFAEAPDLSAPGTLLSAMRAAAKGDAPLWPWVGHPRERLARAAVALAYGADRDDCRREAARLLGIRGERALTDPSLHQALERLGARGG